jgi:GT2 family glycosyltransferase
MANIAKIFVIIVAYKGHQWYERCFMSLRNSEYPLQTIVIDNASNDGTVEYIREHFPEIHLIESKENLGFGRANNIGMRYALDHGCDYVFLLNQDAWIETNTLGELVRIAETYPEYGLLGPVQVNKERTRVLNGVIQFLINPDNVNHKLFSDLILGSVEEVYPVAEINAAAWLLPRKTLETVGGFDPIFIHYGEDWNYLSRVLYHGLKVGIVPHLQVVHDCVDRVDIPNGYAATQDKWLLQRATDLLYPTNQLNIMIHSYRKIALQKLLTGHRNTFLENFRAYRFLKKNSKAILKSRYQNAQKDSNWL